MCIRDRLYKHLFPLERGSGTCSFPNSYFPSSRPHPPPPFLSISRQRPTFLHPHPSLFQHFLYSIHPSSSWSPPSSLSYPLRLPNSPNHPLFLHSLQVSKPS